MQSFGNRIRRGSLYGAVGISALALLSACDWFGGGTPVDMGKLRPGAERDVPVSASLPPPPAGQQYDPPIAPVDSMRDAPQLGSIVRESGGQKAQLEKQDKEEADRDAQEREAREKADKAEKEADDKAAGKQATTSVDTTGGPPTQPVAPARAPLSGTPVPPPTDAAPAAPPSAAPAAKPPGT